MYCIKIVRLTLSQKMSFDFHRWKVAGIRKALATQARSPSDKMLPMMSFFFRSAGTRYTSITGNNQVIRSSATLRLISAFPYLFDGTQ